MRKALAALALLALCGCAVQRYTPRTPAQAVAQTNRILSAAVLQAERSAVSLRDTGVITRAQCSAILGWGSRVAQGSKGMAQIQREVEFGTLSWDAAAPRIRAILDAIMPPAEVSAWLNVTEAQYASLVAAVQAVVRNVTLIAVEVTP